MHSYRASRPWPVAGLALAAAVGSVLLTGAVSTSLPGPRNAVTLPGGFSEMAQAGDTQAAPDALAGTDWKVQVGTFEQREAAEAHLRILARALPQAADLPLFAEPLGLLTRARIGGLPDESAARRTCSAVEEQGSDCFVVPRGG